MTLTTTRSRTIDLEGLQRAAEACKIDTCRVQIGSGRAARTLDYARNARSAERLHKVNSVTKSVLSLLVGIALARGEFPSLGTPLAGCLPRISASLGRIRLHHLLSMTAGMDWPEWGAWGGRPNPMCESDDWVAFILDRRITSRPGDAMSYNSGCSHLLSLVLQRETGMTAEAYAARHLFGPLGIDAWQWHSDPQGVSIGGFGLALRGGDLFKLGQLMLSRGRWGGRRIVPEDWIDESTAPRHHTYDWLGSYGYHWWTFTGGGREPLKPHIYYAMGYGGQFLFVIPEAETVVSFTSDLYREPLRPLKIFSTFVAGVPYGS
ncbi:CubicO group peptidase, beta-lactamase class C family [Cohnella sp. OV330]|uniref:serine hydrolase domain-containing protein n=1 Tax=Cohnella sp. OV330 TaxID=1855288 RepID=UPI0008E9B8D6|nr:serine hydrolase [Cohnella sp. OV330]SFB15335.1 CubicO group peptidase, beta-lactamase class C family [Cohnella sp. OV330]